MCTHVTFALQLHTTLPYLHTCICYVAMLLACYTYDLTVPLPGTGATISD